MCTKHHACRSAKVALNPSHEASCSNPKIANIQMEGISEVDSGCCSSDNCSSGAQSSDEESDPIGVKKRGHTLCWKITGMDCPSCAKN